VKRRRGKYILAVLGAVALAGLGVRAWLRYYPASDLVTAIGLPGPSADVGTRCDRWVRRYGRLHLPTRRVTCARHPGKQWPGHSDEQQVDLDLLTRRVARASRLWTPSDSLAWQQAQDSVRTAIQQRGGVLMACTQRGLALGNVRSVQHWRVGDHTERLVAYHWTPETSLNGEWRWEPWMLQLDAYPGDAPDCVEIRALAARLSRRHVQLRKQASRATV
jgi:hypothetical protein